LRQHGFSITIGDRLSFVSVVIYIRESGRLFIVVKKEYYEE